MTDTHEEWPELVPFGDYAPSVPFPIAALPPVMRAFATSLADHHLCPIDMPATMCLGVVSAAIAGRTKVRVDPDWAEPANMYMIVVAEPSTRKSPLTKEILAPLELEERHRLKEWKANVTSLINDVKSKKRKKEELAALEGAPPRMLADDITTEALCMLLQHGPIAIITAEAKPFEIMTGLYKKDGGSDSTAYLGAWSQDPIRVDRVQRGSVYVPSPTLTMMMAVQPDAMKLLSTKPELRGRGLLARFLIAYPPSVLGSRNLRAALPVDPKTRDAWRSMVTPLVRLPLPGGPTDILGETGLSLGAYRLMADYRDEVEVELGREGRLAEHLEYGGKLPGHCARLALVLHAATVGAAGIDTRAPISEETMGAAISLSRYYEAHTTATWDAVASDARSVAIVEWLSRRPETEIDARFLMQRAPRPRLDSAKARALLVELAERGYLRRDDQTGMWAVSPRLRGTPSRIPAPTPNGARTGVVHVRNGALQ